MNEMPPSLGVGPAGYLVPVLVLVLVVLLVLLLRQQHRLRSSVLARAQEAQDFIKQLQASSLDAVVVTDCEGRITSWSPRATAIFGWSGEKAEGVGLIELITPPRLRAAHRASLQKLARGEPARLPADASSEHAARRSDGTEFPAEIAFSTIAIGGQPHYLAIVRDISLRHNNARRLREEEERYRAIFQQSGALMLIVDPDREQVLQANETALKLLGKAADQPLDSIWGSPPHAWSDAREVMRRVLAGQNQRLRWTFAGGADHRAILTDLTVVPLEWQGARVTLWSGHDRSAEERAEENLRAASHVLTRHQAQLDSVFALFPSGLLLTDESQRVVRANDRALVLLRSQGRDVSGMGLRDLLVEAALLPPDQPLVVATAADTPFVLERKLGSAEQESFEMQLVSLGEGLGDLVEIGETTQRTEAVRRQLRAQRLESLGTLAGGVAHDINNALAPIRMGVDILRSVVPEQAKLLDTLDRSSARAASMVRQLLAFARGVEGDLVPLQPRRLVEEVSQFAHSTFPSQIEIQVDFGPELALVQGDSTQLHQVLLNLAVNARDAMPNGGTLSLSVRNVTVDPVFASSMPDARAGSFVEFSVRDTGTGIPAEIIDRIFEPFFTTKGMEQGTGLGLSTVLGIVRSHHGFLNVQSQPGEGSCFQVFLPAHFQSTRKSASPFVPQVDGRGQTVLIVDDEQSVRLIAEAVFREMGFEVLLAADGTEAITCIADYAGTIGVIMLDLRMPHMDGHSLLPILRRMLPETPVIVASGHLGLEETQSLSSEAVAGVLAKPYTKAELLVALHSVFGEKRDSPPPPGVDSEAS